MEGNRLVVLEEEEGFGGNIQAVFYRDGRPMWVSDVVPGNVNDLAAARENVLEVLRLFVDEMPALADRGYLSWVCASRQGGCLVSR
jgi:hypothetical protein